MNKLEILNFLKFNPACFLATMDNGQPRVRGILIYRADDDGILFHTGTMKDLYKQLTADPRVELCFNSLQDGIQVRVMGEAEEVDNRELKDQIVAEREFIKPWLEEYGDEMLAVFRVSNCQATVWTLSTNFDPKNWIRL